MVKCKKNNRKKQTDEDKIEKERKEKKIILKFDGAKFTFHKAKQ